VPNARNDVPVVASYVDDLSVLASEVIIGRSHLDK